VSGFTEAVRQHQSMVFSLAYRFLQDRALAEDVTQEVFLQLYREQESLTTEQHIRYWLRKVASHRSIDAARRRKLRPRVALEEIREPAARESFRDPLLSETLRKLVATLPETPRMIMVLRYQEDMDPNEIAETVGIPVATVKSHLHRSLAMLREKMQRLKKETCNDSPKY
jgi:RNA polymerase sigma-70 factor (ECF subfamily)